MSTHKTKREKEYAVLRSNISYNVRKFRKEKRYTQEELAEFAEISYDFMRRLESKEGKCGLSVYTLYKLALALNVPVDQLLERKIPETPIKK